MQYKKCLPFCLVYIILFISLNLKAQISNLSNSVHFGINVNLHYSLGKHYLRKNFPGIKAFVGFNTTQQYKLSDNMDGLFNLGTSITIYNKTLGNSLNIEFQDNQIDWTSNLTVGGLWGEEKKLRLLQTINNSSFYNLQHYSEFAAFVGVNFIMNNHKRHQTNGSLGFTWDQVSFNYYNDGGPIFNMGLGDNFDRFWTGGMKLFLHDEDIMKNDTISFNRVEFSFDQFTGYKPQMFEIANIIGFDIQDYDIYEAKPRQDSSITYSIKPHESVGYDYNASCYNIRYNFSSTFGINLGILGSLRNNKNETYFALQDIIHSLRNNPIHPNKNSNKIFFGFNYNDNYEK